MIVRDSTSNGVAAAATSLTISHTCTGSNLLLIVGVGHGGTSDLVSGVTYNGVAMTRIGRAAQTNSSYLYYLLAPATGAHNIVVTTSSSTTIQGDASSYTGVKQTGQPDATITNTAASATSVANTLTTTVDNCLHMAHYFANVANPSSVSNGVFISAQVQLAESSPLAVTPAGPHTMSATSAPTSQDWATVGASFSPSLSAGIITGEI